MHNSMCMAICGGLQYLVSEFLDSLNWQRTTNGTHVLLEVIFTILKDEIKVVFLIYHFHKAIKIQGLNKQLKRLTLLH